MIRTTILALALCLAGAALVAVANDTPAQAAQPAADSAEPTPTPESAPADAAAPGAAEGASEQPGLGDRLAELERAYEDIRDDDDDPAWREWGGLIAAVLALLLAAWAKWGRARE